MRALRGGGALGKKQDFSRRSGDAKVGKRYSF